MSVFSLHRLSEAVGPLFVKELLVTSRRARYYMLRFAYTAVLGLMVSLVWLASIQTSRGAGASYHIAQLTEMGKYVVSFTMCFQFAAAQIVAIILLSTAINEEIYQRTLVPILTTPIGYWQIVMGKFLGKLLHVGLLLAISLPLLSVIRVLGGVPWDYILSGVCITITAAMFSGAVGLLFSVINRRPYLAILAAVGVVTAAYVVVGLVLLMISSIVGVVVGKGAFNVVLYGNPVGAITYETMYLYDPRMKIPGFYWPIHCAVVMAMTGGVLKLAEVMVRKTSLRRAVGFQTIRQDLPMLMPVGAGGTAVQSPVGSNEAPQPARRRLFKARGWNIKRIIGNSPIIWREFRKPLLRDRIVQIVAMCAVLFYLLYTYAILGASGAMSKPDTQGFFVCMFLLAGMVCTAMDSATCIAPEKQARTWPALLCTPVSDWHILFGKAGGTAFRCMSVWVFLIGHVLLFTLLGMLHPLTLIHILMLAVGVIVFLTCSGVYFSTKYRNVTTALLMNLGMAGMLWLLVPAGANLLGEVFGDHEIPAVIQSASPMTQAWTVAAGGAAGWFATAAGRNGTLAYPWPGENYGWVATTVILFASMVGYGSAGVLFAWRAKRLFRKNVFDH